MTNKIFKLSPLAICLAFAAGSAVAAGTFQGNHFDRKALLSQASAVPLAEPQRAHAAKIDKRQRAVAQVKSHRYIVQLAGAPLATYKGQLKGLAAPAKTGSHKLNFKSSATQQYRTHLAKAQASFASTLKAAFPGAQVERQFDTVFNGVVVKADADGLAAKLAKLPGVKAVYPDIMREATMDVSLPLINAPAVWETLSGRENAGKGVRVAVIDTGIRPENPMFAAAGLEAPANLPTDDYCHTTDPGFCNNKLIVARWSPPTFETMEGEHMSPLGFGGHGSHVAGTAVGNKVTANAPGGIEAEISGVAPGAYLMVYKALFETPAGTGSGSDSMLLQALDWAVEDGADVINNSWGGGAGGDPALSPYGDAFEAAEAAGVIVVTAAGNDGPGARTVGCPGCVESGITVASSQHGRVFRNFVNAGSLTDIEAQEGTSPISIESNITAPLAAARLIDATNEKGCSPFAADAFKDKIALISRGSCAFAQKAAMAAEAGAAAMIVYNTADALFTMGGMDDATIPAVMVTKTSGESLITELGATPDLSTTVTNKVAVVNEDAVDAMSGFSSRGPNGDSDVLKPDVTAPGSDILSAISPDEAGEGVNFALLSGTSMASPHIAGSAALMRTLHPNWTPIQVKSALVSTANTAVHKEDNETAADPFDMGGGRADLAMASNAALAFDKVSIASHGCVFTCSFERTLTSLADGDVEWQVAVSFTDPAVTGSVSANDVTIAKDGTAKVTVKVDTSHAVQDNWYFGQVTFTDKAGVKPAAHMAIAVYALASDDQQLLGQTLAGSALVGKDFDAQTVVNNTAFSGSDTLTLQVKIPEGLTLSGEPAVSVKDGQQNGFEVNSDLGTMTWVGRLAQAELTTQDVGPSDFQSIVDFGADQIDCSGACDDEAFTLSLDSSITFNGVTYNSINFSTNGYVTFGDEAASTARNQQLPNSTAPNAVAAPFWTDLDFSGTAGDGTTGIYYGAFNFGSFGNWLIIEWNNAPLFGDTAKRYTVQLWAKLDGEGMFFSYGNLSTLPSDLTVGVENASGTVGESRYYNGSGTAPLANDFYEAGRVPGGNITLDYQLKASGLKVAQGDALILDEDTDSTVDVLVNDTGDLRFVNATLSGGGITRSAFGTTDVQADGALDPATIAIDTAPAHGTATVADGKIGYTPNADYAGSDSFTYTVADAAGNVTSPATVSVTVNNVNDAPTVTVAGKTTANGREVVELVATGADLDGDTLSYTWRQVSGPTAALAPAGNTLKVTLPNETAAFVFEVVANDGEVASAAVTHTVNATKVADPAPVPPAVDSSGGGGSFGWLGLALLPLALRRRQR
ncbi:MAG: S8 family serine peptidase [Gammaproteobacteria bacterium]|nr:S8 family serine peptidase [Gammaproteobacteria bacterium]